MQEFVERHANVVDGAAVVVTDGNLPPKGLHEVASLCARSGVPLVFEPTSVAKCSVPFSASVSQFVLFFCCVGLVFVLAICLYTLTCRWCEVCLVAGQVGSMNTYGTLGITPGKCDVSERKRQ